MRHLVLYERILNAEKEPGNWLTYSGNYSSHRYSPLNAITRDNVASLRPVWVFQTGGGGSLETSPIVVDGIMYITQLLTTSSRKPSTSPARAFSAEASARFKVMTPRARSVPSTSRPAKRSGSSASTRRCGPACFRPRATSFFAGTEEGNFFATKRSTGGLSSVGWLRWGWRPRRRRRLQAPLPRRLPRREGSR